MASTDQLERALRNAHDAGDTSAARVIAAELIKSRKALEPSMASKVGQGAVNVGAGLVRGAGSIGSTLLWPIDKATDLIKGDRGPNITGLVTGKQPISRNEERRQQIDAGLTELVGSDPTSTAYGLGKLGGEIAGTAGAGSALAAGARSLPAIAALGRSPALTGAVSSAVSKSSPLLAALESGGMSAGGLSGVRGLAARTAGGAVSGGASAGMVDPESAGTGALIGGALPGGMQAAGRVGRAVGSALGSGASSILGLTTGVGAEPIKQAFKAGRDRNATFLENMRGDVPLTDVLDQAKAGLQNMSAAKSAQYRSGMIPIKGDKSVLSFSGIDKALNEAANIATYKGQVKNASASKSLEQMRAAVDEWKQLDPGEFHTPEGLDALKQRLSGVIESIPFEEKTARLAAGKVYNATKAEIERQAPTYAKVMKDYSKASEQIAEIERALSLNSKASKDTAMRKLQSLMRNNVQTNYGNRLNLANTLENDGGVELLPALSGQALNSLTPRSLSGQMGAGLTGYAAFSNPAVLASLPFQSPRIVGSMAYGAGKLSSLPKAKAGAATQKGLLQMLANDPSPILEFGYQAAPVGLMSAR